MLPKDNHTSEPKAIGRPTAFKKEYCELARNYALMGATDKQLSEFLGVSEATLNVWKKKHPDFLESLKVGKAEADARVAQSLYHRALGYQHPDVDIKVVGGEIVQTPTIKRYPPDTTACIFWLKNRQREQWRDKTEQAVDVTVTTLADALRELDGKSKGLPNK